MVRRPILCVPAIKVGALDVWLNSFILQGEAGSLGFPPDCKVFTESGVYGKSEFQPFLPILMYFLNHTMFRHV